MSSPYRRAFRLLLAPLWAGLGAVLSVAVPPAGLLLVPFGAARLGRSAIEAATEVEAFFMVALAAPVAFLLAALVSPGGAAASALLGTSLFALPALALLAGARDGRRRDALFLVVAATSGIGLLAVLLGFSLAGTDPGPWLAARLTEKVPEIAAYYRSSGWEESAVEGALRIIRIAGDFLAAQLPGLTLSAAVLFAAFLVYPLGRLWNVAACAVTEPSFARFGTPLAAAVAFIPAGLAAAVAPGPARQAAIDLLLPLLTLFFLRGLAIIRALLDRGRAGPVLRALVYVVVLQVPLPFALALGGLLDEFLDVRGRVDRWSASRGTGGPTGP